MKAHFLAVLAAMVCGLAAREASADWRVWTLAETRRVLGEDTDGNVASVALAAARNESESFQILMRSDAAVRAVRVEPGDLVGPGGAVLKAADARVFRQHPFQLTVASHRNSQFRPGWYPDALIPSKHPMTGETLHGARLTAMPFDLPAGQTHGFWVDLVVPPGALPGQYQGVYRVTGEGVNAVEIPVTLTVWGFELPRVSTMATALGSPAHRLRGYYRKRAQQGKEKEPADWDAVDAQCARLLSEHRINATPPKNLQPVAQPDGSFVIPSEQIDALRAFVDQYHVNALQTVHPRSVVKDPEAERAKLHAWLRSFDRAAKELERPVLFYTYLLDEPNDEEAYRYVQKWGRAIREANSALKVMVVEQPQTQNPNWGDLYGAVDIWCPLFCLFDEQPAKARQALGETIWTYTALCQGKAMSPWWQTDFPLLHYRVPAWIAWRYGIRGILYWGGLTFWDHVEDPWMNPETYNLRKQGKGPIFNGEGSLVYPGRAVGYDGIASSLRLKALRDAIEDYEYLAILQRLGRAPEAEKIVLPLARSWFDWEPDPAAYQKARAALAELILQATPARGD